jgi:hypothetical protein
MFRGCITESDRESSKDKVVEIVDDVGHSIAAFDEDTEVDDSPSKRSRTVAHPRPSMSVNSSTLEITDTDARSLMRAHQVMLAIVRDNSMIAKSLTTDPSSMLSMFIGMASTPFAAFYLDLHPASKHYRTIRSSMETSVHETVNTQLDSEGVPNAKELVRDLCGVQRGDPTPMQQLLGGKIRELVDSAMDKIRDRLNHVRSEWRRHSITFAETRVFTVSLPERIYMSLPRVDVSSKLLPIDILPRPGVNLESHLTHAYGPSGEDRVKIMRIDEHTELEDYADVKPNYISLLDAIKYELTLYAFDKERLVEDIPLRTTKKFTVDLITTMRE